MVLFYFLKISKELLLNYISKELAKNFISKDLAKNFAEFYF
jgi:hypothetical protein